MGCISPETRPENRHFGFDLAVRQVFTTVKDYSVFTTMKLPLLFLLSCAMASASDCDLSCNGGICKFGSPEFGYAAEMDEEDPISFSNRNTTSDNMYCQCPRGYSGEQCEISFVMCEENQGTCSNGALCQRAQDDLGGIFYHCECDPSSDFSAAYAIHFCREAGMVFCSKDVGVRNAFCNNGGRCKQLIDAGEG